MATRNSSITKKKLDEKEKPVEKPVEKLVDKLVEKPGEKKRKIEEEKKKRNVSMTFSQLAYHMAHPEVPIPTVEDTCVCGSDQFLEIMSKSSDLNTWTLPSVGKGDYVNLSLCVECGRLQGFNENKMARALQTINEED